MIDESLRMSYTFKIDWAKLERTIKIKLKKKK